LLPAVLVISFRYWTASLYERPAETESFSLCFTEGCAERTFYSWLFPARQ